MTIVNHLTFIDAPAEDQPSHNYWIEGTVEVTICGKTRRVKAHRSGDTITAFELSGRYMTGNKAWPASVQQRIDPKTGKRWDSASFGRDDRSGRFNKMNAIFFTSN